jgi:hypothetical protein
MTKIHEIEGFDPDGLFSAHMFSIGYRLSFTKSLQLDEGGGDNQNPQENFLGSHQLLLQDDINIWLVLMISTDKEVELQQVMTQAHTMFLKEVLQ